MAVDCGQADDTIDHCHRHQCRLRARVQGERITRADIEAFGTTAGCLGCNAVRSGQRAQAHSDPCPVRIEERLKPTPEGAQRLDRRCEVLNEALAREVERNVRRRQETGSAAGESAVPQGSKDAPIPPDSDPRRRRAMKPATAVASGGSSQMDGSRAVADESRMYVEGEEKDESSNPNVQNVRRRIMTKTSTEESRMDDEGEERDELRSSTVLNARRRIVTKTPLGREQI